MKKITAVIIACFIFIVAIGQNTGIGTTSPQNKLHIAGGLRVDTLANAIDSGILRHNKFGTVYSLKFSGLASDVLKGDGTFGTPDLNDVSWKLTGNTGINPALHYIGTADNKPLYFRINNEPAGWLEYEYGTTALGQGTLSENTTGVFNSAFGNYALLTNSTGHWNTATGSQALLNNTSGTGNTANGFLAMATNMNTGNNNTAIGIEALNSNTSGNTNSSLGSRSLYKNTSGYSNVALGTRALYNNLGGHNLVAVGDSALYNQSEHPMSEYKNTGIGSKAGYLNSTGYANSFLGFRAGYTNTTGFGNTSVGSGADMLSGNLSNATAIGYNTVVSASNKIRLGNGAVTVIEGQVAYTFPSDGRFKTYVTESVKGISFIMRLRPVIYNFQNEKYIDFIEGRPGRIKTKLLNYSESEKIRHSGFVAQEVEKAAKEVGYDFNGVVIPKNENEAYGLSYSQFVVPLVKAVQEQQQLIGDLNNKIDKQQLLIEGLIKEMLHLKSIK